MTYHFMLAGDLGKNDVEWTGKAKIRRVDIPGCKQSMQNSILTHSRLHRENLWQLPVLSREALNFRIYYTPQWENLDNTRHKNTNHTDLWMRRWHQCPLPWRHWRRKCSCRSQPSAWCTSWAPWAGTSHDSCSRSPRSGFLHHHIVNRFRNLIGLFLQMQMHTSPFCMWIHTEDLGL